MIICGGENTHPREIEDALFAHEALAGAVVVGLAGGRLLGLDRRRIHRTGQLNLERICSLSQCSFTDGRAAMARSGTGTAAAADSIPNTRQAFASKVAALLA
jgi:acyl-CoA synthetase (AMP-forming)/AMP-acid ligase II